jgi:hypothetical protein
MSVFMTRSFRYGSVLCLEIRYSSGFGLWALGFVVVEKDCFVYSGSLVLPYELQDFFLALFRKVIGILMRISLSL